jgi:hypothetical protein
VPPKIERKHLKDITVSAGEMLKSYNTKLIIRSCKRSDQGTYTVLAKNSVGKDMVTVNLKVLDKPGPPEGPLKVK